MSAPRPSAIYVRATAEVAVVDAVGIGVGIAIVGVPLAAPLGALVFLAAFVPIVGAVIAGAVAVLVALVAKGLLAALIVLLIVIAVMQLESHILQPWLLGRAVRLHPPSRLRRAVRVKPAQNLSPFFLILHPSPLQCPEVAAIVISRSGTRVCTSSGTKNKE